MPKQINRTNQFKRDFKLAKKQGKDLSLLLSILELLAEGKPLPEKNKDHLLINFDGCRECHITPDWLLIYKITDDELILVRLDSHSELFNK